jgi:hypothetical protein
VAGSTNAWFGLIVNPRDGRPFAARLLNGDDVFIYDLNVASGLDMKALGHGYFDLGDPSDDVGLPAFATGFPRVHLPDGVWGKHGEGLGTVLYTALCTAAALDSDDVLRLVRPRQHAPGICSGEDHRSAAASRWWRNAVRRFGLADEVETELEYDGYRFSVLADVYRYQRALDAHLVALRFRSTRAPNEGGFSRPETIELTDPYALAALSFVGCSDWNSKHIAWRLIEIAAHHGLPQLVIDGMVERLAARADPDETPVRRGEFYDPTRSNPSPVTRGRRALLRSELGRVAKLRAKLGWGAFR